ncbi:hypothetical protein QC764_0097220 [Podospora pseudoanserina]|uniref:Uncharacterized protein n=1 Tax=Podospora pseudoanserina TaxID=2609844 RepID=A0ABR0HV31_9PEZI|nr:hypothetical protein QC764_0097220 [Podospora pseudoanserina]
MTCTADKKSLARDFKFKESPSQANSRPRPHGHHRPRSRPQSKIDKMAPQLRRLLPNKGLSWPQGDVVLGKTRRDRSVVDTLARFMPLDKQNVRGFLLKMVEFALGMGRWLVEQHEESCAPPETVVKIDPFWVF